MLRSTLDSGAHQAQAAAPHSLASTPATGAMQRATLAAIDKRAWDGLFAGDVEGYDLYRAFEAAPPPGFQLGALTVEERGRLLAAAPVFTTSYRLDTPFQGRVRKVTDWLHGRVPALTEMTVAGIGSPMSDNCSIGLAPGLDPAGRERAMAALLSQLAQVAREQHANIVALKSVGGEVDGLEHVLREAGFRRVTSVPVVMLPLHYASLDHYLGSLPEKDGSYLRRKLRSAAKLHIEYRASPAGLEDRLADLLRATLAQSRVDYGDLVDLHPRYFSTLMARLGDRARLMLCWKGDELLSFQLFLVGDRKIIANKIGMKYPEAREYNLYFVNFLKMIELAIEMGVPEIEMGATSYAAKLLFGGRLERRWLYFRFRRAISNRLIGPFAPLFDYEHNDLELQRLAARGCRPLPARAEGRSR